MVNKIIKWKYIKAKTFIINKLEIKRIKNYKKILKSKTVKIINWKFEKNADWKN